MPADVADGRGRKGGRGEMVVDAREIITCFNSVQSECKQLLSGPGWWSANPASPYLPHLQEHQRTPRIILNILGMLVIEEAEDGGWRKKGGYD